MLSADCEWRACAVWLQSDFFDAPVHLLKDNFWEFFFPLFDYDSRDTDRKRSKGPQSELSLFLFCCPLIEKKYRLNCIFFMIQMTINLNLRRISSQFILDPSPQWIEASSVSLHDLSSVQIWSLDLNLYGWQCLMLSLTLTFEFIIFYHRYVLKCS